ncbi:hypothetical protein Bca4012_028343 [Brassica carinata]
MVNPWFPPHSASAPFPSRFTPGDSPLPDPPDPPDPNDPFPPLGSVSPKPSRSSSLTAKSPRPVLLSSDSKTAAATISASTASKSTVISHPANLRSGITAQNTVALHHGNFKILPPKLSSPIQTNRASSYPSPLGRATDPLPPKSPSKIAPSLSSNPNSPSKIASPLPQYPSPLLPPLNPIPPPSAPPPAPLANQSTSSTTGPSPQTLPQASPSSSIPLIEKIRKLEDKTLRRLAPVTLTDKGVPRVLIPDSVFEKGAEIHKNFIICYFNGRSPPMNQVQSVLNHMWGKGKRVEIHPNPLSRSMLVRIPSDYLRQKILEKSVWYVGESMFHAVQWSSSASASPPSMESIQIWAHLTGVPLDLRHEEGLSLVAGLIGDPKETDDFTKNLVSLSLSHVKVAVDLTKPLPKVVEFMRQSGEVVEVQVSYPWVPPTCSHCKELGHISRNCLLVPPPPKGSDLPAKKGSKSDLASSKRKNESSINVHTETKAKAATEASPSFTDPPPASTSSHPSPLSKAQSPILIPPVNSFIIPASLSLNPPSTIPLSLPPKPPSAPLLSPSLQKPLPLPLSPPDSFYAPSLKRPRPDSPPQNFPSFTAQLSFFSSSAHPASQILALPSTEPSLSNPFSVLDSIGSLHQEETID